MMQIVFFAAAMLWLTLTKRSGRIWRDLVKLASSGSLRRTVVKRCDSLFLREGQRCLDSDKHARLRV